MAVSSPRSILSVIESSLSAEDASIKQACFQELLCASMLASSSARSRISLSSSRVHISSNLSFKWDGFAAP